MPVIIPSVCKRTSMSCTSGKPAGLITKRKRLWCKRSQRMLTYLHAIGVATEFGSGGAILQIVFAIVFGHPGTFNKRVEKSIIQVFTEALPSKLVRMQTDHLLSFSNRLKGFSVYLHSINGIHI